MPVREGQMRRGPMADRQGEPGIFVNVTSGWLARRKQRMVCVCSVQECMRSGWVGRAG